MKYRGHDIQKDESGRYLYRNEELMDNGEPCLEIVSEHLPRIYRAIDSLCDALELYDSFPDSRSDTDVSACTALVTGLARQSGPQ